MSLTRLETDLLTAHVLGINRGALVLAPALDADQQARLSTLISQRLQGIPLQHLLGTAPFRYLDVAVGPGVFIPRPETELIIEYAAPALSTAALVVDLCAGSGAIALAVATEFPATSVYAVERSVAALSWLRTNVARLNPGVHIVAADAADPRLLADRAGMVDVVLSNPPYVPDGLRAALPPEVAHDPDEAVFAGADGLSVIVGVVLSAARLLRPGGLVIVEHDESHQDEVLALFDHGWSDITAYRDLTGRPRFVSAVNALR